MMTIAVNEFTVTRQKRWGEEHPTVEITQGGIDYTGPDALSQKYIGEFETFTNMTEAVETAISIAKAWQADSDEEIHIGCGFTHGTSMPLDCEPANEDTYNTLIAGAKEFDENLPKCAQCGDFLGKNKYGNADTGEYDCCSEHCAEQHHFTPSVEVCLNCHEAFEDTDEDWHRECYCSESCQEESEDG